MNSKNNKTKMSCTNISKGKVTTLQERNDKEIQELKQQIGELNKKFEALKKMLSGVENSVPVKYEI